MIRLTVGNKPDRKYDRCLGGGTRPATWGNSGAVAEVHPRAQQTSWSHYFIMGRLKHILQLHLLQLSEEIDESRKPMNLQYGNFKNQYDGLSWKIESYQFRVMNQQSHVCISNGVMTYTSIPIIDPTEDGSIRLINITGEEENELFYDPK